jgi:hypothetical protein
LEKGLLLLFFLTGFSMVGVATGHRFSMIGATGHNPNEVRKFKLHPLIKGLLLLFLLTGFLSAAPVNKVPHPFFVSVVEVEHNAKEQTLEISCKLFTDDFEKTLRLNNPGAAVDLINPKDKAAMNRLITAYIQKHLIIRPDGKSLPMQFIGFEKQEEAIYSYWQIDQVPTVTKIAFSNSLLYDYKKEQINIIHAIVGGVRKTTKLGHPQTDWTAIY